MCPRVCLCLCEHTCGKSNTACINGLLKDVDHVQFISTYIFFLLYENVCTVTME